MSDLDRRGRGDIWTLTVAEYRAASPLKRLQYRLFRNPLILFLIAPAWLFLILYRFAGKGDRRKQKNSLHVTNAGILLLFLAASWSIGWRTYLMIHLPIICIAGGGGLWLFYVQHQFEGVYWARHNDWVPTRAALEGASFYQLPGLLRWLSGNIGFHHIHHLRPRIPNYHLKQCHEAMAPWQPLVPLKLRSSLRSLRLKLWDEQQNRLVGFDDIKTDRQTGVGSST